MNACHINHTTRNLLHFFCSGEIYMLGKRFYGSQSQGYHLREILPGVNDAGDLFAHVKGPQDVPLIEETLGEVFDRLTDQYEDKELLVSYYQKRRFTWREVWEMSMKVASGLIKLGYKKGDRLGVWLPNCYQWTVIQIATAKLGVILVNVNPAYRSYELKHAANLIGIKGLVIIPEIKTSNYIELLLELFPDLQQGNPENLVSDVIPTLKHIINIGEHFPGTIPYADLISSTILTDQINDIKKTLSNEDDINIQFTSGTTGHPKGATLSHRNIVNNAYFTGSRLKLTEEDNLIVPVPLYHCFGLVLGSMAAFLHGSKIIYPNDIFDPEITLHTISKEKATVIHAVPTMFVAMLEHYKFKRFSMKSMRTGIMAGSNCPMEVMKKVISDMNLTQMTIAYGMTETSPASLQCFVDDPLVKRVETVGRIHDHCEVKIVDENGNTVPINVTGTLHVKGYNVMKRYWNQPEKTNEAVVDGWMNTEDLAMIDEEGFCRIVGRSKDMIIRGGENIYPREIEEFLYEHSDIVEVQVIGVPDRKFGEEVCAWIQTKPNSTLSTEDIKDFCRGKIAHYKIPKYVHFTDSYPMTITGKIQKNVMREQSLKILDLD